MTVQKDIMETDAGKKILEPIADFLNREERAHCLKKATWKTMDMYVKWQMVSKYLADPGKTLDKTLNKTILKNLLKSNKLKVEYDPIAKEIKNIEID